MFTAAELEEMRIADAQIDLGFTGLTKEERERADKFDKEVMSERKKLNADRVVESSGENAVTGTYYQRNREECIAAQRARRNRNRERYRQAEKERRAKNPELYAARCRKWRAENPEKSRESSRKYYLKNRKKILQRKGEAYRRKRENQRSNPGEKDCDSQCP